MREAKTVSIRLEALAVNVSPEDFLPSKVLTVDTIKKDKPDMYKNPASDTYIVFGEAKIEDLSQQAQMEAAQKVKAADVPAPTKMVAGGTTGPAAIPEEEEDGDTVDEAGVEVMEIELVSSIGEF